MSPRPRLVASDLDGTLLRSDGSVSERTARAWSRLADLSIESVLVTARPPRWLADLHGIVGAHGLAICTNGAFVYDVTDQRVVEQQGMDRDSVLRMAVRLRRRFPGVGLAVECADGMYREPGYPDLHGEVLTTPYRPLEELPDHLVVGKLLAVPAGPPEPDFLSAVSDVIGEEGVVAFSGVGALAEISAPGVTKASALARWCGERGIEAAQVWAFGDMPNDLPMLRWAGRSFAMANAHPEVLAVATDRCAGNDEDGVAQMIETL